MEPQSSPSLSRTLVSAWRTLKMMYYANSVSWRALKSGVLVFFGFFLWSAANLLLSYQPDWRILLVVMSYGFVLIPYGPFHHVVVIPLALKLRPKPDWRNRVGRHLPNASLVVFFVLVLALAVSPPSLMLLDISSTLDEGGVDVNPDLLCVKSSDDVVHCHLTTAEGIDSVRVESGGTVVATDEEPPFDFDVAASNLETVVGEKQFQVVLLDENGDEIRRYTRTLSMIQTG